MNVRFELPAELTRYTDGQKVLELRGQTVGAVLEDLFTRYPAYRTRILDEKKRLFPYLLMFHNDTELSRDGLLSVEIQDGDRLEIIAAAEGGSDTPSR